MPTTPNAELFQLRDRLVEIIQERVLDNVATRDGESPAMDDAIRNAAETILSEFDVVPTSESVQQLIAGMVRPARDLTDGAAGFGPVPR